jgi:SAM-dependent methyltransferase
LRGTSISRYESSAMSPLAQIEHAIVSELLSGEAQQQYAHGDIAKRELTPYVTALHQISSAYLSHESGSKLSSPIDSAITAAAYALYYTPINAAKLIHFVPLFASQPLASQPITSQPKPLRVLDLGCGPGTAGLALRAATSGDISLTCVEHSSSMRALATQLLSSCPTLTPLRALTMCASVRELSREPFDLVIAANVFAELDHDDADATLDTLAQLVAAHGSLVLLEPGQLQHTRRLMALRDRVTSMHQKLTPVFPCLRADPCPMLAQSQTDWCHGALEWKQPPLHRQLDQLLGFNKHRIKFSCFIFQDGATLGTGVRVLTPPEKSRAGVEALLCGRELYGIGRIPKQNRSEATRAFEKAKVFDRLICSPPFSGNAPAHVTVQRWQD